MNNKKITVLQVLPSLISGGVERGAIDIAIALKEQGFESLVASNGGPLVKLLDRHGIAHINMPLNSKSPLTIFINALKLVRIINSRKVDIIHARSRAPAWSAFLAHKMTNCKFVTTFHGHYGLKPFKPLKKIYNSIMIKGNRVIAVSKFIKEHILKHYKNITDKITTIYRGVDLNEFCPEKVLPHRLLKLRDKIPTDDKIIITMPGRITPWKGHEVLIESLASLDKNKYRCLIVGDVEKHYNYYLKLTDLVEKKGLQDIVIFTGNLEDMPAVYMLSDIIITPSIDEEPFGRISIEAQAMGRIIIASNVGGFKETIKDKETGFLVQSNNSKVLSETIDYVTNLTEHKKYKIMQAARENAKLFSLEKMKNKTLTIYKELVE